MHQIKLIQRKDDKVKHEKIIKNKNKNKHLIAVETLQLESFRLHIINLDLILPLDLAIFLKFPIIFKNL